LVFADYELDRPSSAHSCDNWIEIEHLPATNSTRPDRFSVSAYQTGAADSMPISILREISYQNMPWI